LAITKGLLSFWNDNISYVLRGTILLELSIRNRISTIKDPRNLIISDRMVQVIDSTSTGEVLLDETLKYLEMDNDSVANWVDLLSGTVTIMQVKHGICTRLDIN
jgi:Golgi phosphoprotein 3